jgi:S-adenosylmethionine synthetase
LKLQQPSLEKVLIRARNRTIRKVIKDFSSKSFFIIVRRIFMYLKLFTSESVSPGHPDKVCDQISDAVLDACLAQDPNSRVACETFATTNQIVVGGEITTQAKIDIEKIARDTLREIGYTSDELGIDADNCKVDVLVHTQSPDISMGVDNLGAGDQGIMFGFATNEDAGYMPLPIVISHKLVRMATKKFRSGEFKWARPDMKSQVTLDYSTKVPKVHTVLMSIQHDGDYNEVEFKEFVRTNIIAETLETFNVDASDYKVLINPTGRFVIGGPHGDAGLTGRKIIVDTYGGYSRHGGGAFSGKDATKVDRSAAYAARYVAKNIVAAELADKCEIQLSYAIGVVEPLSIMVDTFGTGKVDDEVILKAIHENFDLTPKGIIDGFDLRKPIFKDTATYGHFGNKEYAWEKLDKVQLLKEYL